MRKDLRKGLNLIEPGITVITPNAEGRGFYVLFCKIINKNG